MSAKNKLNVVLYWHMHQPEYRNASTGEYILPWTYLHGMKDYVDMAAHLEANPTARAVVNFAPVLLEQLTDYAEQVQAFLRDGSAIHDPLLAALAAPVLPAPHEVRQQLIHACLRANKDRLIKRFPAYHRLAELADLFLKHPDILQYLDDQYITDLLVWYHLAWLGETVRRSDARVKPLLERQHEYSLHERRQLLEIIGELLGSIIPRYRELARRGQIELTLSPYTHPIVPLLIDLKSAREAMPEVNLPNAERYPGGEVRALWHMERGMEIFEKHFGFVPKGCWPSEGSVSAATLDLLQKTGFSWCASGGTVMHNSLETSKTTLPALASLSCIHNAYQLKDNPVRCFFRDDGLSDLIGFTYSNWHADDAVANLAHHLENIADACPDDKPRIVSIILDGENAWEYYPENGYYFLDALYTKLSTHPKLQLTTYSEYLETRPATVPLTRLVAGSWVYGTFSTWIGDADKNRAWDMLCEAKKHYDTVIAAGKLDVEHRNKAREQLAICEGSDWFWWFGDYNPSDTVRDFEHLFRLNLTNLYQILGLEPPEYLTHTFTHGSGAPDMGGVMRRGQEHG